MKITQVEAIVVNLPMLIKGAAPMMAARPRTSMNTLYVSVDTESKPLEKLRVA